MHKLSVCIAMIYSRLYSGFTLTSVIILFFGYYAGCASGKRNVTVWRPSVCLSRRHTHRDSPGCSMRRGKRTFRSDNKEDRHTFNYRQHARSVSPICRVLAVDYEFFRSDHRFDSTPNFTPSVKGWGERPENWKFYAISEYKCPSRTYPFGDFL